MVVEDSAVVVVAAPVVVVVTKVDEAGVPAHADERPAMGIATASNLMKDAPH